MYISFILGYILPLNLLYALPICPLFGSLSQKSKWIYYECWIIYVLNTTNKKKRNLENHCLHSLVLRKILRIELFTWSHTWIILCNTYIFSFIIMFAKFNVCKPEWERESEREKIEKKPKWKPLKFRNTHTHTHITGKNLLCFSHFFFVFNSNGHTIQYVYKTHWQ